MIDDGRLDLEVLARSLKALGHPVRLAILCEMASCGNACCGDIVGRLPLAQSTISQHLKVLKKAGLVEWRADGNHSRYQINGINLSSTGRTILAYFKSLHEAAPSGCREIKNTNE
ncbi:MAG: winged helix-turn-helix transcriptional regulator [Cohaesibacteraceae bacterium]|nr:winged helix-turn-helix transcriptional regulator [Cohaesibacteraceae bacterium]